MTPKVGETIEHTSQVRVTGVSDDTVDVCDEEGRTWSISRTKLDEDAAMLSNMHAQLEKTIRNLDEIKTFACSGLSSLWMQEMKRAMVLDRCILVFLMVVVTGLSAIVLRRTSKC